MAENTVKLLNRVKNIDVVNVLFNCVYVMAILAIILLLFSLVTGSILVVIDFTDCAYKNGFNHSKIGVIKDFEVSAGGFGSSDKCKVVLEDKSIVIDGSVCGILQTGKCLYGAKCSNLYSVNDCYGS